MPDRGAQNLAGTFIPIRGLRAGVRRVERNHVGATQKLAAPHLFSDEGERLKTKVKLKMKVKVPVSKRSHVGIGQKSAAATAYCLENPLSFSDVSRLQR